MVDLVIQSIKSPGDLDKERVVCRATADVNSGDYVLFCAIGDEEGVYAGMGTGCWLPNIKMEAGDNLVIYTKSGDRSSKDLENGKKSHFMYLNRTRPWWENNARAAVLFHTGSNWTKFRVGGFSDGRDTEPEQL